MTEADFQHIRLSMVKDVAVVEIRTKDMHGPKLAQELGAELALVTAQEWARRSWSTSPGRLPQQHGLRRALQTGEPGPGGGPGGQALCHGPGVRLGAEIVGLDKLVDIHDHESSALRLRVSLSRFRAATIHEGDLPTSRDPEEARQEPRLYETSDGPGSVEPADQGRAMSTSTTSATPSSCWPTEIREHLVPALPLADGRPGREGASAPSRTGSMAADNGLRRGHPSASAGRLPHPPRDRPGRHGRRL